MYANQVLRRSFPATSATRSTIRRDDVRWSELLTHFRAVQKRRSSAAVNHGNDSMDNTVMHHQQHSSIPNQQVDNKGAARRKAASVSVVGNRTGKPVPRASSPTLGKKRLASAPVKESMRK